MSLRALLAIYAIDLILQLWQVDGARQPWGISLIDAVATGAIFWLLSFYIAALTGAAAVTSAVSALTAALIALGAARVGVRIMPLTDVKPPVYFGLSLVWLAVGLALALAVALAARRRVGTAKRGKNRRLRSGVAWAEKVAWWSYAIAAIVLLRTILAPFLTRAPSVALVLDTPLIDMLLIVVFVVLGAASGGLADATTPVRASPAFDDETAERHARLLRRSDAVLDRDYADPTLTMPRLAAAVGCSEHQLSAALNQSRGINFFAYLNERRIRAAMVMMSAGGMTMTEIAFARGYNSRSTFYAAFKAMTGQSPMRGGQTPKKRPAICPERRIRTRRRVHPASPQESPRRGL